MAKINTKALKARLTIDDHKKIMKSLGIPIFTENKHQIVYYSGDKNVDALKGTPKLYWYKDTGVYLGYTSSRSYDIISLTQTRLSLLKQPCSFVDAVNYILDVTGIESSQVQRVANPNITDWSGLEKFITVRNGGSLLPTYDTSILDAIPNMPCQAWVDEGISEETQALFRIGWYGREWGTTIPVFNENYDLVGIRCRYWGENAINGKYRPLQLLDGTIYKFPTNAVLYGLAQNQYEIERTGTVMIAESEKAVLKLHSFLGSQSTAVAMFGSQLGLQRRNQLLKLGVNHVVLIVDNDATGGTDAEFEQWNNKIMKQAELWSSLAQVDVVWDSLGLLERKENAVDRDFQTWQKLYEARTIDILNN